MPYLQAPAVNNPFGFQPAEGAASPMQVQQYVVSTSFGTAVLPGDVVSVTSSQGFMIVYTSGDGNVIGVSAQLIPASLSSARRCSVYSDPDGVFVTQLSTAVAAGTGLVGMGIGITTTSTSIGVDRSRMMAGATAPIVSTTAALRVLGIHPIEGIDGSTGTPANSKLLVKFNRHIFANVPYPLSTSTG